MDFSKTEINKAGLILKDKYNYSHADVAWAEDVLTFWRTKHDSVINTFQANFRTKIKKHNYGGFVAQRLKRTPSIIQKLCRNPNMKLSTMQDIAGLRIVLNNLSDVHKVKNDLEKSSFKHERIKINDYIAQPKSSGYRSIHFIYKYVNTATIAYDGLKIELQIRSKLQHTWATAVETMGTFIQHSLKSSEGPKEILDFFSITSNAFAILENSPKMAEYSHLTDKEVYQKAISNFSTLGIEEKLSGFTVAADHIYKKSKGKGQQYHLIILNFGTRKLNVNSYMIKDLDKANKDYTDIERKISDGEPLQAVLVSIDSIDILRKAYPNYFLDTREFIKKIESIKTKLSKM